MKAYVVHKDGKRGIEDIPVALNDYGEYEALVKMADGKASKIIVPTDAVNAVKANVLFSETAGIGDVTAAAPEEAPAPEADPCCDRFEK